MAKTSLIHAILPFNDGTAVLLIFPMEKVDPRIPLPQQMDKCIYAERMPFTEMLRLGASCTVAATEAMERYSQTVREAKIQKMAETMILEPADPMELARIAAQLEGINLDPTADLKAIQDSLKKHDPEDEDA